jgi:hypothetical protein
MGSGSASNVQLNVNICINVILSLIKGSVSTGEVLNFEWHKKKNIICEWARMWEEAAVAYYS